jgi:hypothetical protein
LIKAWKCDVCGTSAAYQWLITEPGKPEIFLCSDCHKDKPFGASAALIEPEPPDPDSEFEAQKRKWDDYFGTTEDLSRHRVDLLEQEIIRYQQRIGGG